jgi:hypothetical protein
VICEICDEEFDTENELAQHKAKMHAGMPADEKTDDGINDDDLEEPAYKAAANE